jgi:thiol-disulfide isomerase/thioredoxin
MADPIPSDPIPPPPKRSSGAKATGAAVGAVLLTLFAWQTYRTVTTRPTVVRAPARSAIEDFGIDRARDPSRPAPPFELVALDGSRFRLSAAQGQVVFVNFWATWCPPCRDELPSMIRLGEELAARYPGQFKMVAVTVDEELDAVREFFKAPPFSGTPGALTIVHDADQAVTKAYYCAAREACPDLKFPETYIVDKSGRLVAFVVGPRDWAHPGAKAFLEALIRS